MKKIIKKNLQTCLTSLNQFQEILFLLYRQRDYHEKIFFYEKIIQMQNRKILEHILLIKKSNSVAFNILHRCYELFLKLSALRYRLLNHSLLEVCEGELQHVSINLSNILLCIDIQQSDALENSIFALEALFQRVLKVILPDPNIFAFFIQTLFEINDLKISLQANCYENF